MAFLKRTVLSLFLGASVLAVSPVVVTPAYAAATPGEVIDLIDLRIAQLQAQVAALDAIIATGTPEQIIIAQATKQQILFRIAQLNAIKGATGTLPSTVLMQLAAYLQFVISNS